MELPYSSQGIILASDKYRESDRLLAVYTREFGKIRVISRGSRKMNSKLSPHLEPLAFVDLMLVNGKSIITLTGSSEIKNFKNLKSKGAYAVLAMYLAGIVNEATLENLPDENIFNLLLDLLKYLDQESPKLTIPEIIIIFKLKLLDILGLCPLEISGIPEVFNLIRMEFCEAENFDRKIFPKQKLEKILSASFAEVLKAPPVSFAKYVSLLNGAKVV